MICFLCTTRCILAKFSSIEITGNKVRKLPTEAGLIDNIVNLIKKETGASFKVVITGGLSDLFKTSIKTKVIQNKNITVKGLIKISKLIK